MSATAQNTPAERLQSGAYLGLFKQAPIEAGKTNSAIIFEDALIRQVLFGFDAGQELTEHYSPRAVVVTLLEGELNFTLEGVTHNMHAGDVLFMAPGARHAVKAVAPSHMQLTMVNASTNPKPPVPGEPMVIHTA